MNFNAATFVFVALGQSVFAVARGIVLLTILSFTVGVPAVARAAPDDAAPTKPGAPALLVKTLMQAACDKLVNTIVNASPSAFACAENRSTVPPLGAEPVVDPTFHGLLTGDADVATGAMSDGKTPDVIMLVKMDPLADPVVFVDAKSERTACTT